MAAAVPGAAAAQAAATPTPARPAAEREMAMFQNSDVVLWLRATDEGMVLVYASPGYRNAFAKPVTLSADEADHWAALADSIAADSAQAGRGDSRSPDTSSFRTDLSAGDLEITTRPRADPPTLAMRLGARSADPVASTFFASGLRIVAPALRDAAHVARQMAAAAAAPPPPVQVATAAPTVAPTTAPTAAPTATAPSTTPPSTTAPPSASPASRATASTSRPATVARPTGEQTPPAPSVAPISPATDAASEPVPQSRAPVITALVSRTPAAPSARWTAEFVPSVASPALPSGAPPPAHTAVTRTAALAPVPKIARTRLHLVLGAAPPPTYHVAAFQAPASPALPALPALPPPPSPEPAAATPVVPAAPSPVARARDSTTAAGRSPVVRATVATATDRVATTTPLLGSTPTTPPSPTPATAALPTAIPPAIPPAIPAPALAVRSAAVDSADPDAGRLSDAVFEAEVRRREPALNSCYTQYGLPNNPTLSGHITIHVSLSDSGEVMRATVADRSWTESAGSSVESCVVHRVFVWHFPVALHSSMHDFTVSFGR